MKIIKESIGISGIKIDDLISSLHQDTFITIEDESSSGSEPYFSGPVWEVEREMSYKQRQYMYNFIYIKDNKVHIQVSKDLRKFF